MTADALELYEISQAQGERIKALEDAIQPILNNPPIATEDYVCYYCRNINFPGESFHVQDCEMVVLREALEDTNELD
jgi:hypothetical protein